LEIRLEDIFPLNSTASIQYWTVHEVDDVQNLALLIVDPNDA
jgi:hypothetical protein